MDKFILKVESRCIDPGREAEFNDWYDNIHIPDIMETPGFIKASRYRNLQPSQDQGEYVAIYEMETDDYDNLIAAHQDNMKKKESEGRITELIQVVSRGIYKKID